VNATCTNHYRKRTKTQVYTDQCLSLNGSPERISDPNVWEVTFSGLPPLSLIVKRCREPSLCRALWLAVRSSTRSRTLSRDEKKIVRAHVLCVSVSYRCIDDNNIVIFFFYPLRSSLPLACAIVCDNSVVFCAFFLHLFEKKKLITTG
jgi:hypothetical protein